MSNSPQEQVRDDQLEAMGRLERRRLLLKLATTDSRAEPRVDFSNVERREGDPDPLVTMRHLHLPVLEESGFIRWDREEQCVTKGPRFDELEPYLKLFRELRDELSGVGDVSR